MSSFNINPTGEAAMPPPIRKSRTSSPEKLFYYLNLDSIPANFTVGWIKDHSTIVID